MQPSEPVGSTSTPASPPPADSTQALAALLDDTMDQAAIAANAQRDEEAGIPQPQTVPQEATPGDDEDAEDDAATADQADSETEPAAEAPEVAEQAAAEPEVKYSRRDAARFAAELEQHKKDLAEARTIVERATGELNAHRAADQHILKQLADISGYTTESNGRYRYDNLRDKTVRGTATDEERQEVAEMTQWHELAGPIYRQAELQLTRAFAADWNALKGLDGVGDEGLAKLNQASDAVAGARELHALAYAAGVKKAKTEATAQIARLQAENKSLKTRAVSGAPQPAVANGVAVPSGQGWRDKAFDPKSGLSTEEFDREVRAGRWLGVDLSSQS